MRYLGVGAERVDVVLLGADERLGPSDEPMPVGLRERYGLGPGRYFLFVGKLSKRRNVPLLIEAFAAARAAGGLDERLVVIGPDNWGIGPLELARQAGVGDAVSWSPHAPMEDLAHLYRGATAFVLPTEHEGFSLTLVEAMACGTPAVVFDHAALDDETRSAALLVRAPTREALREALLAVAKGRGS